MTDPLHIDLDVHVHGGELTGRATSEGQAERPFDGWLELIAALDALISRSEP
jgi:hypothetical protein